MTEPFKLEPAGWRVRIARMLEFRPRELIALAVLVLVIVGGAVFAFLRTLPHAERAGNDAPVGTSISSSSSPEVSVSAVPKGKIYVHVAGAVVHPGVYELEPGARVADALRAAGGPRADADPNSINLARAPSDGERIYVPRKGEKVDPPADQGGASGASSGSGGSGGDSGSTGKKGKGSATTANKVNINTANVRELQTLPGIGPALAQRIVDYRSQHGPFRAISDLRKVHGIGPKKYDSLKDFITV